MIRLVLCDMDGTLVPFGAERVSDRTLAAIRALVRAGVRFGPASGREPVDLRRFFAGDESLFSTGIMANGKLVDVDGRRIKTVTLDVAALRRLEEFASADADCALISYVPSEVPGGSATGDDSAETRVLLSAADAEKAARIMRMGEGLLPAMERGPIPDARIITAGFVCVDADRMPAVRECIERLCPELDFAQPTPGFLDILQGGWNKASALPLLERELGISRDEIAYFGDSENDVAMLEAIPHSFAVSSGSAAARSAARHVIGSADDDAPACVMEALAAASGDLAALDGLLA